MIKINRRAVVILLTGLSCVIIAGCGKKKELDAASSKVLPITVAAPSNTPTPSVEQVDSASSTILNLFLISLSISPSSLSSSTEGVPPPINMEDTLLPSPSSTACISLRRAG